MRQVLWQAADHAGSSEVASRLRHVHKSTEADFGPRRKAQSGNCHSGLRLQEHISINRTHALCAASGSQTPRHVMRHAGGRPRQGERDIERYGLSVAGERSPYGEARLSLESPPSPPSGRQSDGVASQRPMARAPKCSLPFHWDQREITAVPVAAAGRRGYVPCRPARHGTIFAALHTDLFPWPCRAIWQPHQTTDS
jgi:hypothetical protein